MLALHLKYFISKEIHLEFCSQASIVTIKIKYITDIVMEDEGLVGISLQGLVTWYQNVKM